jgi:hypothetical protein
MRRDSEDSAYLNCVCKAIAKRKQNTIAKRSQGDFAAIVKLFRIDCKAISQRLQSYFAAIARVFRSDCYAIMVQSQTDFKPILR